MSAPDALIGNAFSLSQDARRVAFVAGSPTSLPEVFVTDAAPFAPRALTKMTEQASGFVLGSREVISWKSQDGATIEGVLIKPADFDPAKKYPLLCVIHGGPTGVDRPVLLQPDARYYPSDIWAARGALILKVNYRGSAGYGEKFRALNVRNLGVGDAWDVLSGVDSLIAKGLVDPARGLHGLEPGRLHLGVSDHFERSLRGDFSRRRNLQLGDVLLQHRHHARSRSTTWAPIPSRIPTSTRRPPRSRTSRARRPRP